MRERERERGEEEEEDTNPWCIFVSVGGAEDMGWMTLVPVGDGGRWSVEGGGAFSWTRNVFCSVAWL